MCRIAFSKLDRRVCHRRPNGTIPELLLRGWRGRQHLDGDIGEDGGGLRLVIVGADAEPGVHWGEGREFGTAHFDERATVLGGEEGDDVAAALEAEAGGSLDGEVDGASEVVGLLAPLESGETGAMDDRVGVDAAGLEVLEIG